MEYNLHKNIAFFILFRYSVLVGVGLLVTHIMFWCKSIKNCSLETCQLLSTARVEMGLGLDQSTLASHF